MAIARASVFGSLLALIFGCATPVAAPSTVARAGESAGAPPLASWTSVAMPSVVFQGLGAAPRTFLGAADRTWLVAPMFGEILVIEPESGGVTRRLPIAARVRDIAISADGRQLVAIEGDDNYPNAPNVDWLESWELATGRVLFRRPVRLRNDIPGGLIVGPASIAFAECEPATMVRPACTFRLFDARTGAPLDPTPVSKPGRLYLGEWKLGPAQFSADGRFVLVTTGRFDAVLYRVEPPALVAALRGKCAELDRAGRVTWAPSDVALVPEVQAALAGAGFTLDVAPGCTPSQERGGRARDGRFEVEVDVPPGLPDWPKWKNGKPVTMRVLDRASGRSATLAAAELTSSIGAFPDIGRRHDILWSDNIYAKPQPYVLQRASIAEVPRRVPLLDGHARHALDGNIYFGPDLTGAVRRLRTADLSEQPALALAAPTRGPWVIDQFSPLLPDGRFLMATEGGRFVVTPRDKPALERLPWVHIADSSANAAIAGGHLLVGDLKRGFLVVDLATRRQVGTLCTPVPSGESCADALPSRDGRTATLLIGQSDEKHDRLDQVSLPDGRLLASRAIPKVGVAHHGTAATYTRRMGWIDPDRMLWIYGSGYGHDCAEAEWSSCQLTVVDLATDPVDVHYVATPGRGWITPAPDDAFFTQSTSGQHGLILFHPDGRTFLTIGTFAGGGFAFTPDGRFACDGDACRVFRCTFAGHSHPIDHPACSSLRRPGLVIDHELAAR